MRPLRVVVASPIFDFASRVEQMPEPAHIQAFVAEPAMETFHVRILRQLAGLDVYQVNLVFDTPGQKVPRGQFRSVVAPNRLRPALAG